MKRTFRILSVLALILILANSATYAQAPKPPAPSPLKEGAVFGVMEQRVEMTLGEDGSRSTEGVKGVVEERVYRSVTSSMLAQTIIWSLRSRLQYYDYGNAEDVQAMSDNWTNIPVYKLQVVGKLYQNGLLIWSSVPVQSGPNTTYVSSGYSPWFRGYNAFWQSKGFHSMQATPNSGWESGESAVSRQF